jgi:hypothetical protein
MLTAALALAIPACGDGGAPAGSDSNATDLGRDSSVDAGADAGDPFNLPAGGAGHPDVGAKLGGGAVRAGRVTDASQLLEGIKVEGRVGDYKIYNDRVAFIIGDERGSDGYSPYGGELLDAARADQTGKEALSLLGETYLAAGGALIVKPTSVGVVADGSDGGPAIVRVIGEPAPVPIVAPLVGAIGAPPKVHIVIDYVLAAGSSSLEIRFRLFSKVSTKRDLFIALGFTAGDGASFYADGCGYDVKKAGRGHWIAMIGADLGQLWYSPDAEMTPLVTHEGIWLHISDTLVVPAFGEAKRTYHLGLTDGEPEAVRVLLRQLTKAPQPQKVSGKVVDGSSGTEKTVAGARVHVQTDAAKPSYVTMTRAGADGSYTLALDPGSYLVSAAADGYEVSAATKLTVATAPVPDVTLELTGSASVSYAVTDSQGAPLPSKVIFTRDTALSVAPASFGETTYPGGAALVVFAADGKGTAKLPPGSYTVTASRGFEYEIDTAPITVAAGATGSVTLQLDRSVDTTGFMCGDFHLHAMWSPDSSDLYELKVTAAAAEGLELPVITDHEYIADLTPYVTKLGLQKWVRGVVGEELTTYAYGHFNPFPIVPDATKPNMGAMPWFGKDPPTLFADVRKAWPDAVFQINHPRSPSISGYFNFVGYDPGTGTVTKPGDWSKDFDAVEVFNGSGWSANKDNTVVDWFSFLDRGFLVTATGNSDSHHAYRTETGYPRNYVKLSTDEPAKASVAELALAVKDQQVLVSGGPFVNVAVGDKGMGEVGDASSGTAKITIKVQAPTWMPVDTLRVILGGAEVNTVTLDGATADPQNPVVRYSGSLELLPTADTWVVVVVTGKGTLAPVSRNDEPFAVTNPIYLDVDGNGVYDPPKTF